MIDKDILALNTCVEALKGLTPEQRKKTLSMLAAKFKDAPKKKPKPKTANPKDGLVQTWYQK